MSGAVGFDVNHLPGASIALPSPVSATIHDDVRLTKDGAVVRDCTHFSLSMSASRRLCRWVAWNIDASTKVVTTDDQRRFELDPAYASGDQIGASVYANNPLDQGHIAAFSDVSWGSPDVAEQARRESCYFSNITPQLADFNRSSMKGLWGELENQIASENKIAGQRLSELGGPMFQPDDVTYRGVLVPRDFWKIVIWVEDGALRAKGFRLTQKDLDGELGLLPLDEFRVYQQAIAVIAEMVGLNFGTVVDADTAPQPPAHAIAAAPRARRIETLDDVNVEGW